MFFSRFAAIAALIIPLLAAPAPVSDFHLKVRNIGAPKYIENSWIVVYRQGISDKQIAGHEKSIKSLIAKRDLHASNHGIRNSWNMKLLKGYHIQTSEDMIASIAATPEVK